MEKILSGKKEKKKRGRTKERLHNKNNNYNKLFGCHRTSQRTNGPLKTCSICVTISRGIDYR